MLTFIIIIFCIYVLARIVFLIYYLFLNEELGKTRTKYGNFSIEHTEPFVGKWKFIYSLDDNIKKIGNLILAISSLLGILINVNRLQVSDLLVISMFPTFTQIFNSLFEWVEIDTPELHQPIFPERVFFKRFRKKNPYFALWSEVDRLNRENKNILIELLIQDNQEIVMEKFSASIMINSDLFELDYLKIRLSDKAYYYLVKSVRECQKISNHDTDEEQEKLKNKFCK